MIPGSANPLLLTGAAEAGAYEIERSLRINGADGAKLTRTPSTAGNRRTWTWAGWIKLNKDSAGGSNFFLGAGATGTNDSTYARFGVFQDRFQFLLYGLYVYNSAALIRDFSAWGHVTLVFNTTESVAADRIKVYWNGVRLEGTTSYNTITDLTLNGEYAFNNTLEHGIGSHSSFGTWYGYLADIYFIDGQALDPTSFGEFDDNGIWQPIEYTGTYGTNGFHLDFSDNSSAAALGYDAAGSNDWTVNNISVAAGVGNDSLVDVPINGSETDTGVGGEVRGNYCTANPLNTDSTLSNGNLDVTTSASSYSATLGTIGMSSGKWYWEGVWVSGSTIRGFGIALGSTPRDEYLGSTTSWGYMYTGVKVQPSNIQTAYGSSFTTGDIIGIAFDADIGSLYFYKNGVAQNSGTAAFTGLTSGPYFPITTNQSISSAVATFNFGQRPFAYTAPSGFKALCTTNLDAPTIEDPSTVMDVVLYTGNGSTQTISGLEFSPDLVWIKNRAQADNHKLLDTVRGATEELESNTTDAEVTNADGLTAFNSDGFDLGADVEYNTSTEAYVAWNWDAGSSTVTNTDGDITSSVRANPSAGFSIVKWTSIPWTGSAANRQVGHGLNAAPAFIITKGVENAAGWYCYHKDLDATSPEDWYITLNTTGARQTLSDSWGPNKPDSTTFGDRLLGWAESQQVIAYCFAPVDGYSSFGSYTGNGSTDGPFVYTGHRSRWILIKRTDSTGNWYLYDSVRGSYNFNSNVLYPDLSNEEVGQGLGILGIDMLSNGFKPRAATGAFNASGGSYIYAAFAESPFQYARAR